MPQFFKYACRWLMGASAAAMLIASIPAAANAQNPQVITLCVQRNGKIASFGVLNCKSRHQIQLTWNIPGPVGDQGIQGIQGLPGAKGETGPVGTQGPIGNSGLPGLMGSKGPTGPTGQQGPMGLAGPIGNTGPQGPQGPQGDPGTPGLDGIDGANGDNIATLTGGTMGEAIGAEASIQLTPSTGSGGNPTFPIYMAPGNAADIDQSSVQVPTPGGEAFHLQVAMSADAGVVGSEYTFIVCNEADCTGSLRCSAAHDSPSIDQTKCSDDTDELEFLPGDTISILAFNSEVSTNNVDVSWSLDFALGPDELDL
jgi:Collagen triple helix repeat (20 copies)